MKKLLSALLMSASFVTPVFATDYMSFKREWPQPPQHKVFCKKYSQQCEKVGPLGPMKMTADRLHELEYVNNWTNHLMRDRKDLPGKDIWEFPADGKGDCEDYVIRKRAHLIELGWTSSSLVMTIVREPNGNHHMVLTARTNVGDFVLDNLNNEVTPWLETPYDFMYRQSIVHPTYWVEINDRPLKPLTVND